MNRQPQPWCYSTFGFRRPTFFLPFSREDFFFAGEVLLPPRRPKIAAAARRIFSSAERLSVLIT